MGYDCRKATVDFAGRTYTAWFTPEVDYVAVIFDATFTYLHNPCVVEDVPLVGVEFIFQRICNLVSRRIDRSSAVNNS